MPAKQLAIASRENIRRRRRGSERVATAVHRPALQINTGEQGCGHAFLAFAQQPPGLFRILDVPSEQDHSRRLQPRKQGIDLRRILGSIETDDQKLSNAICLSQRSFLAFS